MDTAVLTKAIYKREKQRERDKPLVSMVLPALNEAAILERSLTALCKYLETLEDKYRWEMIIVNDGSTDGTGDLAETFAGSRENIRIFHHKVNFGLGQALRTAFNQCRGDYVVTMDVDLSYSPDHIESLLYAIGETKADVVIASPYMKGGKTSNVPLKRLLLSKCANRFLSFLAPGKLSTLTGMVRAYDRAFLSRLNLKAMDVDIMPEIIYKAMILRARILEIPAHLNWGWDKADGKQRKSSIRVLKSIVSSLLSAFMFRPFIFFILPGLALMVLSLYPVIWVFIHTFNHFQNLSTLGHSFSYRFSDAVAAAFVQAPHAFVVGGICLVVALQFMSLGLLALQNKKYFEELFHLSAPVYKCRREKENKF
jgi:glycosyltransferase involved in cell wall biosynthesis